MDPESLDLLVWLTAENSYWNNVALWLAALNEYRGGEILKMINGVSETGDYGQLAPQMAELYRQ